MTCSRYGKTPCDEDRERQERKHRKTHDPGSESRSKRCDLGVEGLARHICTLCWRANTYSYQGMLRCNSHILHRPVVL